MKGSLRIGTVAGTGVFLHWSFLLLFGWLFVSQALNSGLSAAVQTSLFIGAVFLCVTLHEIGHATMARRFGIRTRDITLLPIGGVARLHRIPEEPKKELLIAIAGPLVNVAIAAGLFVGMTFSGLQVVPAESAYAELSFLTSMFWFNVIVVAFNMLPAFPMDGGRVFRAILAGKHDYADATRTAAKFGQAIAVLFIFFGVFSNWLLALVGVFVFLGATAEAKSVEVRAVVAGATACDAMITDFHTLTGRDSLGDAAAALISSTQADFPVTLSDGRRALLTRKMLINALREQGPSTRLSDVVDVPAPGIPSGTSLDQAMELLAESQGTMLVVNWRGNPVGLLTPDNVQEWIMVESALNDYASHEARRTKERTDRCPAFDEPVFVQPLERDRFTTPRV